MKIELKASTLDGKIIGYSSETIFLVQSGKGKSKYRTRVEIKGNLTQAALHYMAINTHSGYKKRLIMVGSNKPVLARYISY